MATLSSSERLSSRSLKDWISSGSLAGSFIEPEVSIRNTRFSGGRSAGARSYPWMPICISRVSGFQGVCATETEVAKGTSALSGTG